MFFKRVTTNSIFKNSKQIPKLFKVQKCYKHDAVVNVKFRVSQKDTFVDKLKQVGTLIQETKFEDVYYDSTEQSSKEDPYSLTKQDIWLRKRNGAWECKSPFASEGLTHLGKDPKFFVPTFSVVFGEKDIRRELNLQKDLEESKTTLDEDLMDRGIVPFAKFTSTSYIFSLEPKISLDVEASDFGYGWGVLKVHAENAMDETIAETHESLRKYVKSLDLEVVPNSHDLIAEYIAKNDEKHFNILLKAKVFHDTKDDEKKFRYYQKATKKGEEAPEE